MRIYNKIFDYITIVINDKHIEKVEEMIPKYWGIMCVKKFDKDFKLEVFRIAERNNESDSFHIVQLLWKEEALDLLNRENLDEGMKSKTRIQIWEKISKSVSKEKVNDYVRMYLKKREGWR